MIEIKGKYCTAKIFTDTVDSQAISQVIGLCNLKCSEGSRIRMMPDIHPGTGCTVGTTMTVKDMVLPDLVGTDIGCGMETVRIKESFIELQRLDKLVREKIPSGFSLRETAHESAENIDLTKLHCAGHIDMGRALKSLGTLGGGNHFIEADRDGEGNIYLVIHSGSRRLGAEVAAYYRDQAIMQTVSAGENESVLKSGKGMHVRRRNNCTSKTPAAGRFAFISGGLFDSYIHDMEIVRRFASLNRRVIADILLRGMKLKAAERFETVHNYIDTDKMILRKGAVSALEGEKLLIPINMRDGSLICVGKGNPDWNYSAPHGAGRLMSRSDAKHSFTVSQYKKEMSGIYTTSVSANTLDECPMAYKTMSDITDNITPTAEVISVIRPIYNFKAGAED